MRSHARKASGVSMIIRAEEFPSILGAYDNDLLVKGGKARWMTKAKKLCGAAMWDLRYYRPDVYDWVKKNRPEALL